MPFHDYFSERATVNLGVTYKFGCPVVLTVCIELLIQGRLILGLLTSVGYIAGFRGLWTS